MSSVSISGRVASGRMYQLEAPLLFCWFLFGDIVFCLFWYCLAVFCFVVFVWSCFGFVLVVFSLFFFFAVMCHSLMGRRVRSEECGKGCGFNEQCEWALLARWRT